MSKKEGGDTAVPADPKQPKGCSTLRDTPSNKSSEEKEQQEVFGVMVFVF